jgi:hypothetical protein
MTGGGLLCCLAVALWGGWIVPSALGVAPLRTDARGLEAELPRHLTGGIYASDGQRLLFQFQHRAKCAGGRCDARRDFTYPDGRLAATEHVVYQGDAVVSVEFEQPESGAAGCATICHNQSQPDAGTILFKYTQQAGAPARVRTERLRENTLAADMVGPFLKAHWDKLEQGAKLRCRYLVIPRQETVGFTFVKDAETTWRGQPVVLVRMQATSPFVGAIIAPLIFTLQKAPPHRVLQYVGRITPRVRVHGKWQDLDAVTVFDWDSAR